MSSTAYRERITEVNIRNVFHNKSPRIARWIPGFIYRYLEKVVHQEFVNGFVQKHGDKFNLDFIDASMKDFNVSLKTEGLENLPPEGRFIFASNHPLGGFDGLILIKLIRQQFSEVKIPVNDILMYISNIKDFFIPINKLGGQGKVTLQEIDKAMQSDMQILTFPAGLVSRKIKGQIVDLPWQKNFIVNACKYKRDIIPVHFSGRCTNFFYRLSNFRKFLGIKANIEMLYLMDETIHHQNSTIMVKFGEPIPWQTFDDSRKPIEWAKWVKEKAYELDGVTYIPL